jgi:hypothetical protein
MLLGNRITIKAAVFDLSDGRCRKVGAPELANVGIVELSAVSRLGQSAPEKLRR